MEQAGGVVVTGASTGIGAAIAAGLDKLGMRVFAGVRKDADGDRLCAQASERLTPLLLDVVNPDQIAAAAERVEAELGGVPLRGLVNNAGITVNGPLEFLPLADLRRQLEVNVVGQVAVTQAFIPRLRRDRGRIVITGSTSGFFTPPMLGPYCMSKHAMEAFADALRLELRPWNIHVALLQPGAIKSDIWDKGVRDSQHFVASAPPQLRELYATMIEKTVQLARHAAETAVSPDVVVDATVHALTSPRPRDRYLVGKNARVEKIIAKLPWRMRDKLVARTFGIR
ncbi:MAG: SDR family oxidoreductase [Candidatus Hydrogenedentales bacterium]